MLALPIDSYLKLEVLIKLRDTPARFMRANRVSVCDPTCLQLFWVDFDIFDLLPQIHINTPRLHPYTHISLILQKCQPSQPAALLTPPPQVGIATYPISASD